MCEKLLRFFLALKQSVMTRRFKFRLPEILLRKFLSLKQFLKIYKFKVLIFLFIIFIILIMLPFLSDKKSSVFIDIIMIVFFTMAFVKMAFVTIAYVRLQQNKTFKKLWRKIWTIPYRRFLRRDRFDQYAIGLFFIISIITLILHFNNKHFSALIAFLTIVPVIVFSEFQQRKKFKYEEEKLFGINYKNKLNSNRNAIFFKEVYKFCAKFIFLPVAGLILLMSIIVYIPIFDKVIISDEPNKWGALGDYIGSILTSLTVATALVMIYKQQEQIDKSEQKSIQEQFKTTTFANLLEKIEKHIEEIKDKEITKQFYLTLKNISKEIYEYSDRDENIQKKYIDTLKMYINNDVLAKIFLDTEIFSCDTSNNNNLYVNIKNIIDKYSFFEYLHLSDIEKNAELDNVTYLTNKNEYFKKYKISAFEGNDELMSHRIDLEEDDKAFDEYAEHHSIKVRQSVAKNQFTSIKTLKFLSEDEKAEVRQTIAENLKTPIETLEYLSNDEEYCVRLSVMKNPMDKIKNPNKKNELIKKLLEKDKCDDFCLLAIEKKELSTDILNDILQHTETKYLEKIVSHNNANDTTFRKITDIIEKEENSKVVENSIRYLCTYKKLFDNETLVKEYIYLYIRKIQFEYSTIELLFKLNDKYKQKMVMGIILQYLKEHPIDDTTFENIHRFISYLKKTNKGKIGHFTGKIQEKVNQTLLTKEQKEKLLNIFIEEKQTNDPNQNPNSC